MRSPHRWRLAVAALLVPAAATAALMPAAGPLSAAPEPNVVRMPRLEELGAQDPGDAMLAKQTYPLGGVPAGAFDRAKTQAQAVARLTAQAAPDVAASGWSLVGPTNIGGRILDVVVDPQRADTVFAAAASGGVWESTDAGMTYRPVWPGNETQAIGALAITPSGVLYAGTGEAGPGGGSITYGGNGVYRSKDKGKTWERIGLSGSSRIGRIAIDPKDEKVVYVAATGPLFQPGGERGLYRSVDAGETWELILQGENATTGAVDVAIDPENPDNLLVAMWDHLRDPDRRRYNGVGSGLFKSIDGGATWARTALPYLASGPEVGRIGVAYAPDTPNRVYAVASTESGVLLGFYVSDDGGTVFTPRASIPLVQGSFVYGWWFGRIYVDPKDADRVYVAGVNLSVSSDGGTTFGSASGVHADQHGMAWDPKVEDRVYLGNDGGMYRSDDNGTNWEFGQYQPWSQLYGMDVSEQDPNRLVAGLQDNGVNRSYIPDGEYGPGEWNEYVGGDGEKAAISPEDQDIVYGCSQYGACSVSYNGGDTMESFENDVVAARKNWFAPIEFDPVDPSIVYTGGESLWRSNDDARTWTRIGGTTVDFSNGPGRETNPLFQNYGTISAIAPSDIDRGKIYVGTDDGNVWYSSDAGETFTKVTDPDLPKAWVTRLAIDPADPNIAYLTFSGFRSQDNTAYVFRTADGGANWDDITSNLPHAPVNDVVVVGKTLLVATDVGVYLSRDTGKTWYQLGTTLPLAPVTDIRYHAPTNKVYAATFGRGAWAATLPAADAAPVDPVTPPVPPTPPRPQPRPNPPGPLPSTGSGPLVPAVALLATGAAVALKRRRSA